MRSVFIRPNIRCIQDEKSILVAVSRSWRRCSSIDTGATKSKVEILVCLINKQRISRDGMSVTCRSSQHTILIVVAIRIYHVCRSTDTINHSERTCGIVSASLLYKDVELHISTTT